MQAAVEGDEDVLVIAELNKAKAKATGAIFDLREDVGILVTGTVGA